ncbi:LysM peptidoglycan-binding domain-containing protein [Bacillus sp. FJAT-27251]|uniref:LysM peptidoglycan-binding domain-containing protein n=1 Tax=Bacillus sp. FJAT-27251 TaxID=1684142 RepID=UPI0006A7B549|nr:LysM peptidoglycan-binding domain-containing protein [Bacillus sp. FJAT-27251]
MNKEVPYRDEAERLRKKIERTPALALEDKKELPPRSRVQANKRHNGNWKPKYPVIRLLVMFFILMPISIFGAYHYLNGQSGKVAGNAAETGGYEKINVERNSSEREPRVEIEEKNLESKEAAAPITPAPLSRDSAASEAEGKETSGSGMEDIPTENKPAGQGKKNNDASAQEGQGQTVEQPEQTNEPEQPAEEPEQTVEQPEETADSTKIVYHTVGQGENLFRISMKYYQSQSGMEIIRKANNLNGDEIQLGQVLKIPLNN